MKIKRIKLVNFGIHRSLEFNTDSSPVVGLLGKNGSGKSTILDAVKYALTGEIDGKIEEACTVGKKKGYVELFIEKDGEDITIKREVGKAPKRAYTRNGKKITAVKDIELALQDLLSVDKRAMSNACFLRQGSLNELLFGTESSREQLFVKLVNLSFCERYGNIIDTKIKALSAGVEDLQSLCDEVNNQRMDAIVEKELLEKQLSRTIDYSPALKIVSENSELNTYISSNTSDIKELECSIAADRSALGSIFLGYNVKSRLQLEELVSSLRVDYTKLLESKSNLIDEKNLRLRYTETLNTITDTKKNIEDTESRLAANAKCLESLKLPDLHIDGMTEKLGAITQEISKRAEWISLQEEQCIHGDGKCMYCGQALEKVLSLEEIDVIKQEFDTVLLKKVELEQLIEKEKKIFQDYESEKLTLKTIESTELANLRNLNETFGKATDIMQSVIAGANLEDTTDAIAKLSTDVEALAKKISNCEKELARVIEIDSRITANESLIISKKAAVTTKHTKLVTNESKLEDELSKLEMQSYSGLALDKLKLELEQEQKARNEATGRLKQADENFAKVTERYVELNARVEENKHRLAVVDELKEMRDILSRKGLPRVYIEHKFDKLVTLTANNLSVLNADFTVSKDLDNFLSFTFDRFDGEAHVVLPMSRLSGGQKVRLCIAFLLAVQQELVPDIGFQTFDEPSTHLDEEGVERLCAMFKSLQELLRCIDHQVWVCDHNPLLEESFNTTLRL